MSNIKDDPRDSSLEVPLTFPKTWYQEAESFSSSGMLISGFIMVTRNRFLAWPALAFSLNSMFNTHPARQKGESGTWSNAMLCASALVASYVPMLIVTKTQGTPPAT
ncbi:hypothetical protein AGABI1DRAFT_114715 [Agaricus bisporus var. burnettii JB137-S8]|uniref:Uncharacterized protein n=1 Tax=Agaricus bisporus var. burnettii (strain JB137-S8 / ATCC MYA-4627 / FGSC 10392) TaxID=597362 RepID=K5X5G1_AGABU|nr:hypothetical protein AGABI2DRAFT_194904 [Agaricus bisporus var. bisporus H97]XP_007331084.1 uncharacterized protein AGABI1DRAFT_114715 [Agaricus bisporus var. burnettii JB137-S8]EKM78433.1 hypothetical protein AGABI1DRAFT_114715 [Agaricus bisporus var. burnettii JB137-S8]EKV44007.1 hypothetical protein AGABI2DRAFT_194904 [Agaricus bisporus var. bisporus H97]